MTAFDPVDILGGSLASSVLVGETIDLTVVLEPSADIAGTVFGPDGVTPVPGIRVVITPLGKQAISGTDGSYRFDMLPISRSPYELRAWGPTGALRATLSGVTLATHAEEVTADIVLSGDGAVTGLVLNPDGSPSPGLNVTLDSGVPGFANTVARTDSLGVYRFEMIPVGTFSLRATLPALRFAGSASGQILTDGEEVVVDVQMVENQVPATTATLVRYFDGNNFSYAVQQTGAVHDGTTNVYRGNGGAQRGGMRLDVIEGGTATPFSGSGGSLEESGREVAIGGSTASGLNVTRKIFVPIDGYFARYLEVLQNPTGSPITADLRLDTHQRFITQVRGGFSFSEPPRVISTSSGDDLLTETAEADRWVRGR